MRRLALEDYEFRSGNQWDQDVENERKQDRRPCLKINRIPLFIRQITNDQRQNRSSLKVSPVDDKGDVETAKIFQGIIRHIEYSSNADTAYDTAFDCSVTGGFGYMRVISDYVNPDTFDQELIIKRIRNPFSVYFDPYSKEPDGSDANFAFVVDDMLKEDFERDYPGKESVSSAQWQALGKDQGAWLPGDKIRVAEYFYRKFTKRKIYMLKNGTVVKEEALPDDVKDEDIKDTREVQVPVIMWAKISGLEVLEKGCWVGKWIPIIPVYGEEIDINGKIIRAGVVRNARDSQKMYNYMASYEAETIALAPRAPFIGVEGQFEGHEKKWATANRRNHPYLEYKMKALDGQMAPAPARQVYEPAIQSITMARGQAADDLKATTGIYDSAIGNAPNDASGVAIQRRNHQSQTSNFHFVDNLHKSQRHLGRILVDAIPQVYDAARSVRIIGTDDQQEIVLINQIFKDGKEDKLHNLGVGQYDVALDSGPSYATKRQEAVASMMELSRNLPQLGRVAPDLLVGAMDWEGAQDMAARLKKTVPPNLLDDGKGQPELPPAAKQQMQQQTQMIQTMTQQIHALMDKVDNKTMELESKERIEMAKLKTQVEIVLAQLGNQSGQALLEAQVGAIQHREDLLHAATVIDFKAQQDAQNQATQQAAQSAPAQSPQQFSNAPGPQGAGGQGSPTGGQSPGQPVEPNP